MSVSVMKKKKTVNRPPEHEPIHQIRTRGQKIFSVVNYIILGILALICVLPFWYIICLSFSSNGAVMAGKVRLLPVEFNVEAYGKVGRYLFDQMMEFTASLPDNRTWPGPWEIPPPLGCCSIPSPCCPIREKLR